MLKRIGYCLFFLFVFNTVLKAEVIFGTSIDYEKIIETVASGGESDFSNELTVDGVGIPNIFCGGFFNDGMFGVAFIFMPSYLNLSINQKNSSYKSSKGYVMQKFSSEDYIGFGLSLMPLFRIFTGDRSYFCFGLGINYFLEVYTANFRWFTAPPPIPTAVLTYASVTQALGFGALAAFYLGIGESMYLVFEFSAAYDIAAYLTEQFDLFDSHPSYENWANEYSRISIRPGIGIARRF
ncbi:MAG: hypothetical protein LBC89_02015 [Bacteroidales bacterium]|jgi:hypothetical protein|nr:hypothetical protein [Bacteroidales bacterium]